MNQRTLIYQVTGLIVLSQIQFIAAANGQALPGQRHLEAIDDNPHFNAGALGKAFFDKYQLGNKRDKIKSYRISDRIVSFYQREVDGIKVEKDYINSQFQQESGDVVSREVRWRDDIPQRAPDNLLGRTEIEYRVRTGHPHWEIIGAELVYISPESDVYPIDPVPENPCWIVRGFDGDARFIRIYDAITGDYLGEGVIPPYDGIAARGPLCSQGNWEPWRSNAEGYLETMTEEMFGEESVDGIYLDSGFDLQAYVENPSATFLYEIAHGGSQLFWGCDGREVSASVVEDWMADRDRLLFTFLASCNGACESGAGTLSSAFRKGQTAETAVVGYCDMADNGHCESDCWPLSLDWQDTFFRQQTIYHDDINWAYIMAMVSLPVCNDCINFHGSTSLGIDESTYEYVDSETVGINQSRTYRAMYVHVAHYAKPYIADGNGSSGADITINASQRITFHPGFKVERGASLHACILEDGEWSC